MRSRIYGVKEEAVLVNDRGELYYNGTTETMEEKIFVGKD